MIERCEGKDNLVQQVPSPVPIKCNIMQKLHKSLHLTSQPCFSMFLPGRSYPGPLTLKRQAELLEAWAFAFCLSPLQRMMFLLLAAAPARLWLLPCWVGSSCKTAAPLRGWQNELRLEGEAGGAVPKECGPRAGSGSQRVSLSALGAKGGWCKAWPCDPLVQSFNWWWNREEKKYKQELQQGAWGNGNAHHLNNAFLTFTQVLLLSSMQKTLHSGFHSFLQQSTTCLWLYDGCTVSSSPIFLCSIIPDQIPSEISPSCENGSII